MTRFAESYAVWLADYYLLAAILLALALTGTALLKQPAQRLMITKSTFIALVLLAILCALPGWSVVHLLAANRPAVPAESPSEEPMAVSDAVKRPELTRSNTVRRAAPPALAPRTADEVSTKPNAPKMSWTASLAIAHLAGMGCIVVWLALGWITSVRLRRAAQAAPASLIAILNELASLNSHGSNRLQLFTHDRIDVAVALGVWRSMILLPDRWTTSQSHDRLRAVLAHESTHILNHDLQWVALARILFIALWANPLFWLMKRRLRLDQEALADAAAAELTSRQRYAEQLVAWARDARSRPVLHLSSAVGLWEGPSQLRQRIAILLDEQLTVLRNCSRRWRMTAGVFAIGAATALSMVTLQPASRAEEEKPAAKSTPGPLSQESLFKLYRKHFKLPEPNVVGGFVVDEKHQPVAHAQVSLFRVNWRDITRTLIAEKSTDADGKVRFDHVFDLAKEFPDGKIPPDNGIGPELLQVIVRAPGRVTNSRLDTRPLIAKRGEPLMIIMPPAATLRGRVTGPDSKPIAGALVAVGTGSLAAWAEAMTARTNADGNYVIDDVPPFDLKARAEQEAAMRSGKDAAMNAFRASPQLLTLTVEHPNFAVGKAQIEKTPGTTDIQLQPAAILAGRIVFGDSGKSAGGARVWVAGHQQRLSETKRDDAGNNDEQRRFAMPFYTASARADADGKYRFATLPTGYYHLLAEMPGWVNVGLRDVPAEPGKTNEVPDLTLTKGGTVSIRLVDAKTREPIQVPPEAQAFIGNSERPIFDRPPIEQRVPANKNGLFELSLPAGKHEFYIGAVYVGEDRKWMAAYATPAENPNAFVTVTDSKTVQVDMPVIDAKSAKVTGTFVPGPLPKQQPKARPGTEEKQNETSNDKSKQMSTPRRQSNDIAAEKSASPPTYSAPTRSRDDVHTASGSVDFSIIVAKHALLHDGQVIQWPEIEEAIAALPNSKRARLRLYFTGGAPQWAQDAMHDKVRDLEKRYRCKLVSFGGFGQRASIRYDAIHNQFDLVPNKAWRVDGMVQSMDGKRIVGAEVVLCPPPEPSWTFKKVDIILRNGRLREPLDEILAHSEDDGKFAVYPVPNTKYSLVALHPDGCGIVRSDEFAKSGRIQIRPWAKISGRIKGIQKFKQSLFLVGRIPAADGWPSLEFTQYSEEQNPKQPTPDGQFVFNFVPPNVNGVLYRLIGVDQFPYKEFQVAPGATEPIDVEPPTEDDAKKFEQSSKKDLFD